MSTEPTETGQQAGKRKRRTQSERTRETQDRLCRATLDVLAEIGYERASTTIICERAGVSRGAQTHHYASKHDLILAAYDHLLSQWEEERLRFLQQCEGTELVPEAYIRFLWEKVFATKHYVAALELGLAARGDVRLHAGLQLVLSRWVELRDAIWQRHFEAARDGVDSDVFHYMTLCMLRGMTTQESLSNRRIPNEALLSAWLEISHEWIRPRSHRPGE